MKRLSGIVISVGLTMAVLGGCCLDSAGIYGYIAGAVSALGGFVAGIGYVAGDMGKHRERELSQFHQPDRLAVDVEWIELDEEKTAP